MKTKSLGIVAVISILLSCTNDAIDVNLVKTSEPIYYNSLTLTVDPTDLFSSYTYEDTYHRIQQLSDMYRSFNSKSGMFIQTRTLIYKKSGELVDSVVNFIDNTNSITIDKRLEVGDYYAINTLSFATKDKKPLWNLIDREKLSTIKLQSLYRYALWSILSYSCESFSIKKDASERVTTKPKPIGCVVYVFFQNFQYTSQSTYGTVEDNGIRELDLYTKNRTESYLLDPNATNKYVLLNDPGDSWYKAYITRPSDYDDGSWTFFKSNLYGFCYFLDPNVKLKFGYILDGETSFHGYGEGTYDLEPGKTYLAYWDYFKVGNPYFGPADNDHWNSYSKNSTRVFENKVFPLFIGSFN